MTQKLSANLNTKTSAKAVIFEFIINNDTDETVELRFTSGFEADIAIMSASSEVWRWSNSRFFTQELQTLRLEPGESKMYEREWKAPPSGEYKAVATLEDRLSSARASTSFTVPEEGQKQEQPKLDASLTTRTGRNGIEIDFTVNNDTDSEVELVFPDLQTAEFTAFDGGERVWRTRSGFVYAHNEATAPEGSQVGEVRGVPEQEVITLPPGGQRLFRATWFDPDPGTYTLIATLLARSSTADAATRVTVGDAGQPQLTGELTVTVSDEVLFNYEVTNTGDESVSLTFANRPVFRLQVFAEDEMVWDYPRVVLPAVKTETYKPKKSVKYELGSDFDPGEYIAVATLETPGGIAGATTEFTVDSASAD